MLHLASRGRASLDRWLVEARWTNLKAPPNAVDDSHPRVVLVRRRSDGCHVRALATSDIQPARDADPGSPFYGKATIVYMSGVGFWDFPHGQRGHARNYADLHPVTGIRFIAGCS